MVAVRVTVFRNVMSCNLVDISSALKMETADHCEMLVIIYETTRCHFPEERSLKEKELFMYASIIFAIIRKSKLTSS